MQLIESGAFEEEAGWRPSPDSTHVFLCGNPNMIGAPKPGAESEFPETLDVEDPTERKTA